MKNKILSIILSIVAVYSVLFSGFSVLADSYKQTADELLSGIISYKLNSTNCKSIQSFIDNELEKCIGASAEWQAIALSQYGKFNFSLYESALKKYLTNNKVSSASSRLKFALTLCAIGSSDEYISSAINNSIGKQGIMSYVYGLHLLNNGYTCKNFTKDSIIDKIISLQKQDGGFSVMGNIGDVDVTAITLQSLSGYYKSDSKVKSSADKAISFLSKNQTDSGDYKSYGVNNLESTAQVLITLSSYEIDVNDKRFVKNGNTILNGIEKYKLKNGAFSHKADGKYNENATAQGFFALVSYSRFISGKSDIYTLDNAKPTSKTQNSKASTAKQDKSVIRSATKITAKTNAVIPTSKNAISKTTYTQTPTNNTKITAITTENQTNTAVNAIINEDNNFKTPFNYKPIVIIAIIISAVLAFAVLIIKKRRNYKNFIFVAAVSIILILAVIFTNISSADDYYGKKQLKENAVGTVTMSIRCDTVAKENRIILDNKSFSIDADDTAYDILIEAAKEYQIKIDNKGTKEMAYISGIDNLYEFDYGDLSGWMYYINGKEQSVGCSEALLKDGDNIEWRYSTSLGKDIK